ncbi:MAG: NAD-dependent DNA ligase LigA [Bacteroidales bacterium]|jgi:DNA ligase (NAD+)|nr:NAD-dependent DNA ligase LigA [Bacteroidales bacterium]
MSQPSNDIEQRIGDLSSRLNQYNYQYYVLDNPSISDMEFDTLLKELEKLENEHPQYKSPSSPTQRVGGQPLNNFSQVTHRYPMLSLGNTYSKEEIVDFVQRAEQMLGKEGLEWVCELKYDGLAISLNYINGILSQATTRGNGIVGDDVTQNIKTIKTIPLQLQGDDYPADFEIRGEVIFPHKAFEEFNKIRVENGEEPFANPRNAASGSIKLLNPQEVAKRKLDCFLYFLLCEEDQRLSSVTHYEKLQMAKRWGFNIPRYLAIASNIEQIMDFIEYWDMQRKELPFDIDGIVIKLNDTTLWNALGSTAKSPRWATAFKFKAERVSSTLESVEYQVGRTGVVTPVANFTPVWLGGTWVKRASLHNADQISKLGIRIGDEVLIEKGGEIIPKIVEVKHREGNEHKEFEFITHCPVCGSELVKEEDIAGHYCPNYNHCSPQILGRFQHFISKKAMNIDSLGGEKMKYLLDNNLVADFADLYALTADNLIGLAAVDTDKKVSIQEKGATNILNALAQSKSVSFERVLFALGIRFVGEVVAKKIARHYINIDNIIAAQYEDLIQVDEIGEVIAKSLLSYFANAENLLLISKLKACGLHFEVEQSTIGSSLLGKSFVVSGVFENYSRESIKQTIEDNGGKVVSSISSKVNYLVCGDKMGAEKKRKAESLNVKMISEQEFSQLLNITN